MKRSIMQRSKSITYLFSSCHTFRRIFLVFLIFKLSENWLFFFILSIFINEVCWDVYQFSKSMNSYWICLLMVFKSAMSIKKVWTTRSATHQEFRLLIHFRIKNMFFWLSWTVLIMIQYVVEHYSKTGFWIHVSGKVD